MFIEYLNNGDSFFRERKNNADIGNHHFRIESCIEAFGIFRTNNRPEESPNSTNTQFNVTIV